MLTVLDGRIVVTAAGAGIGRAIAEVLLRSGASVIATDVDSEALATLQGEKLETKTLDSTDPDAVNAFFSSLGPISGLVNGVGWVHHGSILDVDPIDWRRSFTINIDTMYYSIRAAIPNLKAQGGGAIVNISSIVSSLKSLPLRAAYGATKAAVIGLSKSIAVDFIGDGIRCNAICPGTIESPSLEGRIQDLSVTLGSLEAAQTWFIERQPMKRLGKPEEIAGLALYLLSEEGKYATGQALVVDGGILS